MMHLEPLNWLLRELRRTLSGVGRRLTAYDILFSGLVKRRKPQRLTPSKRAREIRSAYNLDYGWRFTERMGKIRRSEEQRRNRPLMKIRLPRSKV